MGSPTEEQAKQLSALGVCLPSRPKRIFTATLSPGEVIKLSHEGWIKSLTLSQRLKALPERPVMLLESLSWTVQLCDPSAMYSGHREMVPQSWGGVDSRGQRGLGATP